MARPKQGTPLPRIADNPSFKQYKDTNIYVSKLGEVYKALPNKDVQIKGWYKRRTKKVEINYKEMCVARLVYETYKGSVPKNKRVVHKNGIIADNHLDNLIVVSINDNSRFSNKYKPNKIILNEDNGDIYDGFNDCVKRVGYSKDVISRICNNKYRSTIPVNLRYITEEEYLSMRL